MGRTTLTAVSIAILSTATMIGCGKNPVSSAKVAQAQAGGNDGDVTIALDAVPKPAIDAVTQAYPGGSIIRSESEQENGETVYELHVRKQDGSLIEVEVNAQGKILETEKGGEDDGVRGRPGAGSDS